MFVTILVLSAACKDDGTAADAGPPADARRFGDAALQSCGIDAGCDHLYANVCHPSRGVCVECAGDDDCTNTSLGPNCQQAVGYCSCDTDDDCQGNPNGPRCHPVVHACTCIDRDDCGGDSCSLELYLGAGVRTCVSQ